VALEKVRGSGDVQMHVISLRIEAASGSNFRIRFSVMIESGSLPSSLSLLSLSPPSHPSLKAFQSFSFPPSILLRPSPSSKREKRGLAI
jgi:hypothetical protein